MKKILIVIDMQNDFVTGGLGSERALAAAANARKKIENYSRDGHKIIFTRDTHYENYLETLEGKNLPVPHCIAGTDGREIYGGLDAGCRGALYVDKDTFGWRGWRETLDGLIDDDTEIELVGLCTDICVVSNALILKCLYPENRIAVDASCCAGVTEASHEAALLTMRMCQIEII